MPAYLFHQNVRNLAPDEYLRIGAYQREYAAINSQMGSYYVAAGFTELLKDPRSLQAMVLKMAKKLDAGLTEAVVIYAGTLSGKVEYVGIAYDPGVFTLGHAGSTGPKYSLYGSGGKWGCYNVPAAGRTSYVVGKPTGFEYKPDHRCLGYVAGMFNGNERIFGFTHNDYGSGGRSAAFRNLETAADLIKAAANYNNAPLIIFGGDFNKDPDDLAGMWAVYERRKRKQNDDDNNNNDGLGPGGRVFTSGKNTFDFWMVNENDPDRFKGFVHENTQDPPKSFQVLSEHCGITLKF
jgi:hypothetical protein